MIFIKDGIKPRCHLVSRPIGPRAQQSTNILPAG